MKRWLILSMLAWLLPGWAAGDDVAVPLSLYLNLPSRTLVLYEGGQEAARYAVAIGKPSNPTPTGDYHIERIIFNPNWYNGAIEGSTQERRVPPGPLNPMGQAKIHFSKNFYIHGTPHPWSVGLAISHGCLRLENRDVLDLAQRLMRGNAPVDFAAIETTLAVDPPKPREVTLNHPIAVTIDYRLLTLSEQEGTIWPDIYHRFPKPLTVVQARLEAEASARGLTLQLPDPLIAELSRPVTRRIDFDVVRP